MNYYVNTTMSTSSDPCSPLAALMSVTIPDAVDALGSIASIQAGFMELLKKVYAA